jgi:cytidylate kinase
MDYISVAIDGPAGAGKSTIAKTVAQKLNYVYVDTGAMYRAVTYKALQLGIDLSDETKYDFLDKIQIQLTPNNKVLLDGNDITKEIRTREVSNAVSLVASKKIVRTNIIPLQRKIASFANVIMDGRDIGTNVLKDATLKFFLTASVEERSKRRYLELKAKNTEISLKEVTTDILQRDHIDSNREIDPLVKAEDALEIDTSNLTIDEVVAKLIDVILGKVKKMNDIYDIKKFRVGQIVEGEVISVTDNEVLVDFQYATEGRIYLDKLTLSDVNSAKDMYKVGDKIKAKINKLTDEVALLSRIDLEIKQNYHKIEKKYETKSIVSGKVTKSQKNVFIVNIYGIDCIMPKNEVDVDANFDGETLLNKTIKVKIIDIKKERRGTKIVVSRRAIIAQEIFKAKLKQYQEIEKDAIYEGEVVRVERYGLLVVAHNYQGLVPLREISHLPFQDVSEVAKIGDKVNVKVIDKNDSKLQVLYSIKALLPKPWELVGENIKENDIIEGTIVRITDFGAFINVYPSVDGLLHKSEFSYDPNINMFEHINEGDKIEVKVIRIDVNKEKLSLSVKALKENPWLTCGLKQYDIVEVKVIGFIENDAIISYVEDVCGLLPRNQVTSEKRITKAEDELNIGQVVKAKVMEFNPESQKLIVSIRRIKEDAERSEYIKYMKAQNDVKNNTIGDIFGDKLKDLLKDKS